MKLSNLPFFSSQVQTENKKVKTVFQVEDVICVRYWRPLDHHECDPDSELSSVLAAFAARNKERAPVALCAKGFHTLNRVLNLPEIPRKNVKAVVNYEAKKQLPFALEDLYWDWREVRNITCDGIPEKFADNDQADKFFIDSEIILSAIKREHLDEFLGPFKKEKISISSFQPQSLAFASFLTSLESVRDRRFILALDVGYDNCQLVITNGFRVFMREIPIGGKNFTKSLAAQLKLTAERAELVKLTGTALVNPTLIKQLEIPLRDLANEIKRSVDYFLAHFDGVEIDGVTFFGHGLPPFLYQQIREGIGFEDIGRPYLQISPGLRDYAKFQEFAVGINNAFGAALELLGSSRFGINLLSNGRVGMPSTKSAWGLDVGSTSFKAVKIAKIEVPIAEE